MGAAYKTRIAAATSASTNRFVTSTNMVNSTYTIANAAPSWAGSQGAGFVVTVTHTTATGADTLGTITIAGTDLNSQAQTEVITPTAGGTATGTKVFRTITSATGAGWTISGGNDTIVIGHAAGAYVMAASGSVAALLIAVTAAGTITLTDGSGDFAVLGASFPVGLYEMEFDVTGFLKVSLGAASDITVFHGGTIPSTYVL